MDEQLTRALQLGAIEHDGVIVFPTLESLEAWLVIVEEQSQVPAELDAAQ